MEKLICFHLDGVNRRVPAKQGSLEMEIPQAINSEYFGISLEESSKIKPGDMVIYTGTKTGMQIRGLNPGEVYEVKQIVEIQHNLNSPEYKNFLKRNNLGYLKNNGSSYF